MSPAFWVIRTRVILSQLWSLVPNTMAIAVHPASAPYDSQVRGILQGIYVLHIYAHLTSLSLLWHVYQSLNERLSSCTFRCYAFRRPIIDVKTRPSSAVNAFVSS